MTNVNSEMRSAEMEIRSALEKKPGQALSCLVEAYNGRDEQEREVFALAAFGHLVSVKARESLSR
jgi:hypothetical protein